MANPVEQAKEQMNKSVENTKENFAGIRTGRANPALLYGIVVDYYGAPTPLKAVASIGVPGRENPALQRRNMPRRYWSWLVEMEPESTAPGGARSRPGLGEDR